MGKLGIFSTESIRDRFWQKTKRVGACLIWTASRKGNNSAYGAFCFNSKMYRAHRIAWQFIHGEIPNGLHVLHTCDNGLCVEPEHLFLGTHQDNMKDRDKKGRASGGIGNQKLSGCDLIKIKKARLCGASVKMLSRRYQVHETTIRRAIAGITYKKVKRAA